MNRSFARVVAATVVLILVPPAVEAKIHRGGATAPHLRHAHRHLHASHRASEYDHGAGAISSNGYEDAPTDRSYQGPGATVFGRTVQFQHAPGVTRELDPAVRESATGGPSGGLPNNGAGP